jgi:hypothetical protein
VAASDAIASTTPDHGFQQATGRSNISQADPSKTNKKQTDTDRSMIAFAKPEEAKSTQQARATIAGYGCA